MILLSHELISGIKLIQMLIHHQNSTDLSHC